MKWYLVNIDIQANRKFGQSGSNAVHLYITINFGHFLSYGISQTKGRYLNGPPIAVRLTDQN